MTPKLFQKEASSITHYPLQAILSVVQWCIGLHFNFLHFLKWTAFTFALMCIQCGHNRIYQVQQNNGTACAWYVWASMEWHMRGGLEVWGELLFCSGCTNLVTVHVLSGCILVVSWPLVPKHEQNDNSLKLFAKIAKAAWQHSKNNSFGRFGCFEKKKVQSQKIMTQKWKKIMSPPILHALGLQAQDSLLNEQGSTHQSTHLNFPWFHPLFPDTFCAQKLPFGQNIHIIDNEWAKSMICQYERLCSHRAVMASLD